MKRRIAPLSEAEIKELKEERVWGYIFATFVVSGCFLAILVLCILKEANYELWIAGTIILGALLAVIGCFLINRKVLLDIKGQEIEVIEATIDDKLIKESYEAGSGALHIPLLAQLSPKHFGGGMRKCETPIFIIKGFELQVDEKVYESFEKGMCVLLIYSKRSDILLRIQKV